MNGRIRELADQILPNEKEFHQGDPREWGYFFSGEELEKFALLIVRECAHFVEDKFDFCGDELLAAEKLKEHFGVKE